MNWLKALGQQVSKKEGNADPALKLDFYIFLQIFQHKLSTNEKVLTEKQNFNLLNNNVEYQGHLNVMVRMLYVGEKVLI